MVTSSEVVKATIVICSIMYSFDYNKKNVIHKCVTADCNNPQYSNNTCNLCVDCNYKMRTAGGLKCQGWMSVPCKYNGFTVKDTWSCQQCNKDAQCMIGAFDNDRS